jgi:hypothetical protein
MSVKSQIGQYAGATAPRTQPQVASIVHSVSGAYYIVLPDESWYQARAGKTRIFRINRIGATPE